MHVENELERPVAAWEDEDDYNPARGYNVAPRTRNAVILRGGASDGRDHEDEHDPDAKDKAKADKTSDKVLRIENMQWGLIPHWMKRTPGMRLIPGKYRSTALPLTPMLRSS
jgi:putative SOS response-associated peptidase YedK